MKSKISKAVSIGLLALASSAFAQDYQFYDKNGNPAGSAIGTGGDYQFYDKNGNPAGNAIDNGGSWQFYDKNGNPTGSAEGSPD